MSRSISIDEAAGRLESVVNDITTTGEAVVLTKGGKPVAELRATPRTARLSELRDVLEAGPRLTPQEAADFARDVEAAQAMMNTQLPRDPWES